MVDIGKWDRTVVLLYTYMMFYYLRIYIPKVGGIDCL